ncbi:MAG: hypothetical protein SVU88_01345 [Candidatus Nanohaloarchaea archaeon]|nr:hypothetical protein [Candidatus Nanohaloarchaea archaeon]
MDIAREDWLLVFIVAAGVLPFAYSAMTGSNGGDFTPETELERECVSYADAVEANASASASIKDCRCTPPDQVNEERLATPEKVKEASTAFLITCTLEGGRTIGPFAIWRIRDGYAGDLNRTNASVLERAQ